MQNGDYIYGFKNSKTSDPHRLLINLTDNINLTGCDKYVALSDLSIYYALKVIKKLYKNKNLKYLRQRGMIIFNYLMGHILYQDDIQDDFDYIIKKYKIATDNPPVKIYVSKIENGITFEIKTEYSLKILMPKMVKLLGSTKSKIIKDENGKYLLHLEIT